MAKTNYTKVEEALAEGMRKMEVNRLLNEADENAAATSSRYLDPSETTKITPIKVDAIHLQRLKRINLDLKALQKTGKDPYKDLKIDKAEIKRFINDPALLTLSDWEKVKTIKELIAVYKEKVAKKNKIATDDDLINGQVKDQKTKRFNINDKWIPLR